MFANNLANRKSLVVLGLNSGTSADGIDMAAVKVMRDGNRIRTRHLGGSIRQFPTEVQQMILKVADSESVNLDEVVYLDSLLGQAFARASAGYIRRLAGKGIKVHLISSHGQTVRHLPARVDRAGYSVRGTWQLGSADIIAARTSLPVVSDFRQAAVAVGHEGAPITAAAMQRLFGQEKASRLIVNLGGMANYFYLPLTGSGKHCQAADCGPANSLSDLLAKKLYSIPIDRYGRLAARGLASMRLLTLLQTDPFFSNRLLSTGREAFGPEVVRKMIQFGRNHRLPDEDLMATACELTAVSVAEKLQKIVHRDRQLNEIHLMGGGRRNRHLVTRLQAHLPNVNVVAIDTLGCSGDLVEAAAFAVLGEAFVRSEALPLSDTHSRRRRLTPILGKMTQPPKMLRRRVA